MCTFCHDPHQSNFNGLKSEQQPELCYSCHEKEVVLQKEVHQHERRTICMECHRPHAGKNRFLLD
jgi:predicted CXXCH cytochrome family protein